MGSVVSVGASNYCHSPGREDRGGHEAVSCLAGEPPATPPHDLNEWWERPVAQGRLGISPALSGGGLVGTSKGSGLNLGTPSFRALPHAECPGNPSLGVCVASCRGNTLVLTGRGQFPGSCGRLPGNLQRLRRELPWSRVLFSGKVRTLSIHCMLAV